MSINYGRFLAQGGMGYVNMWEDFIRAGGTLDPATLETIKVVSRRLAKVISDAENNTKSGEEPPEMPGRRRAIRPR